jgi:hypothetical protein
MPEKAYRTEAPAKLNIRLKITGKRPDGYHELVSIMVPVSLLDFIEIRKKEAPGIDLSISGLPLPQDESNLVTRAAQSFFRGTGLRKGFPSKSPRISLWLLDSAGSRCCRNLLLLNELYSRLSEGRSRVRSSLERTCLFPFSAGMSLRGSARFWAFRKMAGIWYVILSRNFLFPRVGYQN